jgi:hypothetical protein
VVDLVKCQPFIGRRNNKHAIIGGLKVKNCYFITSEKGASKKFTIITIINFKKIGELLTP